MSNNNECMCGAKKGTAHDEHCPYPYFGQSPEEQETWLEKYLASKYAVDDTQEFQAMSRSTVDAK